LFTLPIICKKICKKLTYICNKINQKKSKMKKPNYYLITVVAVLFAMLNGNLSAQDTLSGIIKYQKITKLNFKKNDNPRWNDMIANLPSEQKSAFVLYFENEVALYENNPGEQETAPRGLQRAQHVQQMRKPPRPELKKVYYDLENNKMLEQLNFMTRNFIIESEIEIKPWKLTADKKKILDYVCMSAELKTKKQIITAWFTPQIPVSVGPDKFFGLPGIILAVEKNGETIFMATSVELIPLEKDLLLKPDEGKKVTREKFDKIIDEKLEEFKKTARDRGHGRGQGRGHGRR
jgi:GLPGLI family protein